MIKKTVWMIYNELASVYDWRFHKTRKECQEEIDRVFPPVLQKIGQIKPTKVEVVIHDDQNKIDVEKLFEDLK